MHAGSTHDSFIWKHSAVRQELRTSHRNGQRWMLLGDSGYPLEPWLLTPDLNAPVGSPAWRYTSAHGKTRNCVERTNGAVKVRFRSIMEERVLRYAPKIVGPLINACCALHNLCIAEGLPDFPAPNVRRARHIPAEEQRNRLRAEGLRIRNNIINSYF